MHSGSSIAGKAIRMWRGICFGAVIMMLRRPGSGLPSKSLRYHRISGTGLVYYEEEYHLFEIGYNFGKEYWGHGFATETMEAIVDFAKNVLKVKELVGRYAKENPASGRVMDKLGFRYFREIPYEANEGKHRYNGVECRLKF